MAEQLDRARLAKLMGMTTSDQDGEALNALRMANKLIAGAKLSWPEVLGFSSSTRQQPFEGFSYEAARKYSADFGDAMRGYNSTASNAFARAMQSEKADVAKHRVMLDEILKRDLGRGKRDHFLSIRRNHALTGAISTNHRAQIARAFYSQDGWDQPLGGENEKR